MNVLRRNLIGDFRLGLVLVACSLAIVGCSKKIEENTETPTSQVVAHVGNDVITTQELDNELRIARIPADKRKDEAQIKQVLGELAARKYMARKALDAKLDREPTVLLDLLRAREIVLSNAAATRDLAEKSSAITKGDIDNYIARNPLKFADRQVASTEQIVLPANAVSQSLMEAVPDLKSLDQVEQKLTTMGIAHTRSLGTLNSADVSPEFFNLVKEKRSEDNVFFLRAETNAIFFKINAIEGRPVEGDEAVKLARQAMQIELMKSEASLASVEANLAATYEGEFANIMKSRTTPK
jgi:EpsD family peptidyl-prolyl cis-trans isomerase